MANKSKMKTIKDETGKNHEYESIYDLFCVIDRCINEFCFDDVNQAHKELTGKDIEIKTVSYLREYACEKIIKFMPNEMCGLIVFTKQELYLIANKIADKFNIESAEYVIMDMYKYYLHIKGEKLYMSKDGLWCRLVDDEGDLK